MPISFYRDGVPVAENDIQRLEQVRARHMMALLMRKLGPAGMARLFADEITAHTALEQQWLANEPGTFSESAVVVKVPDGDAREFIDWFVAGYNGPNAPAMQRAHPEHLGAMPEPDGRIGILEVPGHSNTPALLHLRVLNEWSEKGIALDPDMPHRMMGRFETPQGDTTGYLLHQMRNTVLGFEARLAIYWPAGAPESLVQGHRDHLMVEFSNWFRMYLLTREQPDQLMAVALNC